MAYREWGRSGAPAWAVIAILAVLIGIILGVLIWH